MSEEQKKEEEIIYEEDYSTSGSNNKEETGINQLQLKINKLKEKLKKCNEEKQEYLTGWQRTQADFINYRRRQEEQMSEWLKVAQAGLVGDLLPILDTLEAGIRNWESEAGNHEKSSIKKIKKQFLEILRKHGLEEIKTVGERFNPEYHEAIEQVEADEEEDIIVEEAQKGYLLNGKVIRTAKVNVSKKRSE